MQKLEYLHLLQKKLAEALEKSKELTEIYDEIQILSKTFEKLESETSTSEAQNLLLSF